MTSRQRNEEEMTQQITKRAAQTIIGKTRVSLAKQLRNRVQKAIKKINQQTRVLLAKLLLNKKKNPLHVQA
jgi:membrane-bound lytic murein transglycosylase B